MQSANPRRPGWCAQRWASEASIGPSVAQVARAAENQAAFGLGWTPRAQPTSGCSSNRSCAAVFLQGVDGCSIEGPRERVRVRDDEYLTALRCRDDQPRERFDHVGMEARFRFVESQEWRRTGREQGREQEEESQRSVRGFGRLEWPEQTGYLKAEGEPAGVARQVERGVVESARDGVGKRRSISDLADRHQGGGKIAPVMCKSGRAHADLRLPRRSVGIGSERVVEAPASEPRAQLREQRKALGLDHLRQHRLASPELERKRRTSSLGVAGPGAVPAPFGDGMQLASVRHEEPLFLYVGVERERPLGRRDDAELQLEQQVF